MNLLSLRYFITIAEYSSFTKASEHLFVTQPTLSRQILDLEEELGVQLFVRGRHSLKLTDSGVLLLHEAQEIIRRCDNLRHIVKQERDDITGALNIGYQGFLDTKLMYSSLKSITKSTPHVDFSLSRGSSSELAHQLLFDKCDVIFTIFACVDSLPDVESIQLQENQLHIAIPFNHRLSGHNSVHMKVLANESFIMLDRKISPVTVDYSTGLCMKNGFSPNVSYYVDDVETALFLVGSGKGITFVFSKINTSSFEDIKILNIDGIEANHDLDFVLAYKKSNTNPILPVFVSEVVANNKTQNTSN